jgi:hypothetical protein
LVEIELKLFLDVEKLQIHQPCALQLKSSFFKPPFPQQIFMKSPPPYTQRNQYSIPREIKERERELYTKLEIHNVPGWLSPAAEESKRRKEMRNQEQLKEEKPKYLYLSGTLPFSL